MIFISVYSFRFGVFRHVIFIAKTTIMMKIKEVILQLCVPMIRDMRRWTIIHPANVKLILIVLILHRKVVQPNSERRVLILPGHLHTKISSTYQDPWQLEVYLRHFPLLNISTLQQTVTYIIQTIQKSIWIVVTHQLKRNLQKVKQNVHL